MHCLAVNSNHKAPTMFWIYYSILCICVCMALLPVRSKDGMALFVLFFLFVILVVFSGLRSGDRDFLEYQRVYELTPEIMDFTIQKVDDLHGELGYIILSSLVKSAGFSFNLFLILISIISLSLFFISSYRLSLIPVLSVAFYFSHFFILREMMQIRAGVAISIILFSFSVSNRIWAQLVGVLLASLFHSASLIFIPFLLIIRMPRFNWLYFIASITVAFLLSAFGFLNFLLEVLSDRSILPQGVSLYMGWSLYDYRLPILTNPVVWKSIIILYLLRNKGADILGFNLHMLRNAYAAGLFLMICFSDMAILSGRLATFLYCAEPILIVWALFHARNEVFASLFFYLIIVSQLIMDLEISGVHEGYKPFFL